MKKVFVIISILVVFAVLAMSCSAAPIFDSDVDIKLGPNDFDELPSEILEKIDKEVEATANVQVDEETGEPIIEDAQEDEPEIAEDEGATTVSTAAYVCGDVTVKWEQRGDGKYITGYEKTTTAPTDLDLTDHPNEFVGIAQNAFKGVTTLKKLDLTGTTIKSIGLNAFYGCTSLGKDNVNDVKIPNTVTTIGGYAFINTPWLKTKRANAKEALGTRIVIVNGILIDGILAEGDVEIPESVTKISSYAFSYNTTMTSLIVKTNLSIPYRCCSGATGLRTVEIDATGGVSIASFGFFGCTSLKSVDIEGVVTIDTAAFEDCSSLTDIDFGEHLVTICRNAFVDCTALENLEFPTTLEKIETAGFLNCSKIKSLLFKGNDSGKQVVLGQGAFQNCTRLDVQTEDDPPATGLKYLKTNGVQLVYTDGVTNWGKDNTFFNTKDPLAS